MFVKRIKKILVSQHVQSIDSSKKIIVKDLRAIDDVFIDNFSDAESIPSPNKYGSTFLVAKKLRMTYTLV